jgi:cell wall-associated NlpC family hydrolase
VRVLRLFEGTPYLWAGNTGFGIDCSGLVQAALIACGIACPGDSDLQEAAVGRPLSSGTPLRARDLVFWKGHVAMLADDATLLHANGAAMSVAWERLPAAIARMEGLGLPVRAVRRLD